MAEYPIIVETMGYICPHCKSGGCYLQTDSEATCPKCRLSWDWRAFEISKFVELRNRLNRINRNTGLNLTYEDCNILQHALAGLLKPISGESKAHDTGREYPLTQTAEAVPTDDRLDLYNGHS